MLDVLASAWVEGNLLEQLISGHATEENDILSSNTLTFIIILLEKPIPGLRGQGLGPLMPTLTV